MKLALPSQSQPGCELTRSCSERPGRAVARSAIVSEPICTDTMRIDKSIVGLHLYRRCEGCHAESHKLSRGDRRTNFDRLCGRSKVRLPDTQMYRPKGRRFTTRVPETSVRNDC